MKLRSHYDELVGKLRAVPKVNWQWSVIFSPGLFFIILGVMALLFPRFLIGLLAAFLVAIGSALVYGAWKLMQLKSKVEQAMRGMQSRVVVQTMQMPDFLEVDEEDLDSDEEKIILH